MVTLQDVLRPVDWEKDGPAPAYVVAVVIDGAPFVYPFISRIEADIQARSFASRNRAVTVVNLATYEMWSLEETRA